MLSKKLKRVSANTSATLIAEKRETASTSILGERTCSPTPQPSSPESTGVAPSARDSRRDLGVRECSDAGQLLALKQLERRAATSRHEGHLQYRHIQYVGECQCVVCQCDLKRLHPLACAYTVCCYVCARSLMFECAYTGLAACLRLQHTYGVHMHVCISIYACKCVCMNAWEFG